MDHVAIMQKSWNLIPKILSGEKTIESRWYKTRRAPWDKVKKGDTIYFKNSSEPITTKVKVTKVIQYYLNHSRQEKRVKKPRSPVSISCQCSATLTQKNILKKYGRGLGIEDMDQFYEKVKNKKYCILIFLENPRRGKPFNIEKSGFGAMSAWITLEHISLIRI